MIIKSAEFIISAVSPAQFPDDDLPEIALAGRSNVGKSSLINRLIGRKNLARTSSTPGKTQQLNYYRMNDAFYFVDFPGYGFAKVSKQQRNEWGKLIERYLKERKPLRLVLHLVDLRHPPTEDDRLMADWLAYYQLPVCVVATKADKISKGNWAKHAKVIKTNLALGPDTPLILFSSETGQGREELWSVIEGALEREAAGDQANGPSIV